jgi:hypothetical protein
MSLYPYSSISITPSIPLRPLPWSNFSPPYSYWILQWTTVTNTQYEISTRNQRKLHSYVQYPNSLISIPPTFKPSYYLHFPFPPRTRQRLLQQSAPLEHWSPLDPQEFTGWGVIGWVIGFGVAGAGVTGGDVGEAVNEWFVGCRDVAMEK